MRGAGEKAFCAGGDIRSIYDLKKAQAVIISLIILQSNNASKKLFFTQSEAEVTDFFYKEYDLDIQIATLPENISHIALLNGIVMGGGVSYHLLNCFFSKSLWLEQVQYYFRFFSASPPPSTAFTFLFLYFPTVVIRRWVCLYMVAIALQSLAVCLPCLRQVQITDYCR